MKKHKVKRTTPLKGPKFGPMMGRGSGTHVLPFTFNDERIEWKKSERKK